MKYLKEFENNTAYNAAESGLTLPNVSLCISENVLHYNPYIDPCASQKVRTTYDWIDIGGTKWCTKNIGALTVTDYGQYFQFGDVQGFNDEQVTGDCHSKIFNWPNYKFIDNNGNIIKYNSTDNKTTLETVDDAAIFHMGQSWRMPTANDYAALGNNTIQHWAANYLDSGINGIICIDKTDETKVLFFPAAGFCTNGITDYVNSYGFLWSSSRVNDNIENAYALHFRSNRIYWQHSLGRSFGFPIRGIII